MGARTRRAASARVTGIVTGLVAGSLGGAFVASPAAAVATDQTYWVPVDKRITVLGRGYGHGHGMSQHGAQGAALQGLTHDRIVEFYYPGTVPGTVRGKVRVLVSADTSDDVVVGPAPGLAVRDLTDGSTHPLPASDDITRWRLIVRSGRTVVQHLTDRWRRYRPVWARSLTGDAEFFASSPITLWTPSGSRTYRGTLRSAAPSPGATSRDTVNVVTMDEYVMGVVPYEMPPSWHPEAVKAQAVAARTYATWSRDRNRRGHYQICDTTACQVYAGTGGEDPRSTEAVRATRARILTFEGRPAFTQFSASNGGWTAAGSVGYLAAKEDPYDGWSGNSHHAWSVTVDAARLERSHPSVGRLTRLRVTARDGNGEWQGRVDEVVLEGTDGTVTVSGERFRWTLGLKSRWFSVAPTPIMSRWARIGGAGSVVGAARGAEYAVASGAAQRFERGRIFYSRRTGPRELYGVILAAYVRAGGPSSDLGFPRTPVRLRGRNRLARFEHGSLYFQRPAAPVAVTGPIDVRYNAVGGAAELGWPTRSNYAIRRGERVDFERGSILWNRRTGRLTVLRTS